MGVSASTQSSASATSPSLFTRSKPLPKRLHDSIPPSSSSSLSSSSASSCSFSPSSSVSVVASPSRFVRFTSVEPSIPRSGLSMSDLTFVLSFQYLPLVSICTLRCVSRSFSALSRHHLIWASVRLEYSRETSSYPPLAAMLGINATTTNATSTWWGALHGTNGTSSGTSTGTATGTGIAASVGGEGGSGGEGQLLGVLAKALSGLSHRVSTSSSLVPPLANLSFDSYSFRSPDLSALSRLSKLRSLSIRRCYSSPMLELCSSISHGGGIGGGCKSLKELVISDCKLTDDGVAEIAKLGGIEKLNLSMNRALTSACCVSIAHMTSLRVLDLSECRSLGPYSLQSLCSSPFLRHTLTELSCRGLELISDDVVQTISSSFPLLRILNLRWCKLVGDEGVKALVEGCKELEMLNLSELREVTSQGVNAMMKSKSLMEGEVDLRWNKKLDADTRKWVKARRPKWKVDG